MCTTAPFYAINDSMNSFLYGNCFRKLLCACRFRDSSTPRRRIFERFKKGVQIDGTVSIRRYVSSKAGSGCDTNYELVKFHSDAVQSLVDQGVFRKCKRNTTRFLQLLPLVLHSASTLNYHVYGTGGRGCYRFEIVPCSKEEEKDVPAPHGECEGTSETAAAWVGRSS